MIVLKLNFVNVFCQQNTLIFIDKKGWRSETWKPRSEIRDWKPEISESKTDL
jgi:hypothetical protein